MTQKSIWLREEISIADELLELVPQLREEFLNYHQDFLSGPFAKSTTYTNTKFFTEHVKSKSDAWKTDHLKYTNFGHNFVVSPYLNSEIQARFPTACALTKKWGDACPISSYSVLEYSAAILRHHDPEYKDGLYIRIHIPLIIPEGDIFLEVEGIEINWHDIFAFDNQMLHSAHNHSDQRRLVYILDIRRDLLGIIPGQKKIFERFDTVPPFVRGALPKLLHTCQLSQQDTIAAT